MAINVTDMRMEACGSRIAMITVVKSTIRDLSQFTCLRRRECAVGIMTGLRAGQLKIYGSTPGRGKRWFSLPNLLNRSETHTASYSMDTVDFHQGKAAGA